MAAPPWGRGVGMGWSADVSALVTCPSSTSPSHSHSLSLSLSRALSNSWGGVGVGDSHTTLCCGARFVVAGIVLWRAFRCCGKDPPRPRRLSMSQCAPQQLQQDCNSGFESRFLPHSTHAHAYCTALHPCTYVLYRAPRMHIQLQRRTTAYGGELSFANSRVRIGRGLAVCLGAVPLLSPNSVFACIPTQHDSKSHFFHASRVRDAVVRTIAQ
jgi:hypothetical protein